MVTAIAICTGNAGKELEIQWDLSIRNGIKAQMVM
jgi:hypothetical protein